MKNIVKIIWLVMLLFLVAGYSLAADSPSDYVDLFYDPQQIWYCSQSSNIGGVSGAVGVCSSGLYYYVENRQGFKDLCDVGEPKIACKRDTSCSPTPSTVIVGRTIYSPNPSDGKVPTKFRIYIPPGITNLNLQFYVPQDKIAAIVRLGQPPTDTIKPVADYYTISPGALVLNNLMYATGDLYVRNGGGLLTVFAGTGGAVDEAKLSSLGVAGRWLYVKFANYDATWLQQLSYSMTVNYAPYKTWYDSMTVPVDQWACFNDPGNTAKCSIVPSYTVSFSAATCGTIIGAATQTVSQGKSTVSVEAKPNCNYTFLNWTGSDGSVLTANPLTVSNVMANATYTANFQPTTTSGVTVNFTTTTNNISGQPVSFTNTSTTDTVQSSWLWDFGDTGSVTNTTVLNGFSPNPVSHTYNKPGNYIVTLTAKDTNNAVISKNQQIVTVICSGSTVTANFTVHQNMTADNPVTFTNTSTGADKLSWSFLSAIGIPINESSCTSVGSDKNCNLVAGNYTVTLTATDINGCNSTKGPIPFTVFEPASLINKCDVNSDAKLGLEEVIYILQVIAGLR